MQLIYNSLWLIEIKFCSSGPVGQKSDAMGWSGMGWGDMGWESRMHACMHGIDRWDPWDGLMIRWSMVIGAGPPGALQARSFDCMIDWLRDRIKDWLILTPINSFVWIAFATPTFLQCQPVLLYDILHVVSHFCIFIFCLLNLVSLAICVRCPPT